ncbi:MAG TPA: hypothetical protein VFE42_07280 [Chloroflexota bacterium]|nr:hypothetical protein [Chloroflexota bacterium]
MTDDRDRRRRLRLGALLYRLHYFAVPEQRDAEGRISLYRHDARRYVTVTPSGVRLVSGGVEETLDLEAAIARCQEALGGQPLHRASEEDR